MFATAVLQIFIKYAHLNFTVIQGYYYRRYVSSKFEHSFTSCFLLMKYFILITNYSNFIRPEDQS